MDAGAALPARAPGGGQPAGFPQLRDEGQHEMEKTYITSELVNGVDGNWAQGWAWTMALLNL